MEVCSEGGGRSRGNEGLSLVDHPKRVWVEMCDRRMAATVKGRVQRWG